MIVYGDNYIFSIIRLLEVKVGERLDWIGFGWFDDGGESMRLGKIFC